MSLQPGALDPDRYRAEGYEIASRLIPEEALRIVTRECSALFRVQLDRLGVSIPPRQSAAVEGLSNEMQALLAADLEVYLATVRHMAKLASVQELFALPAVKRAVEALGLSLLAIPSSPVVHVMSDQLKIPGGYYGVVPHQDWPSVQGGLKCVVVWIPITDVDVSNFPMGVIPGSHLRGLWDGDITSHAFEIREELLREAPFVPLQASLGDAVLMTAFTVHRTSLTYAEGTECHGFRLAFSMRFEDSSEADFAARGYPCAYRRVVDREFITPDYPPAERVRALFSK